MFHQPFQTIVVGVDLSAYSKTVVKQAQYLSRLWKTKLILMPTKLELKKRMEK